MDQLVRDDIAAAAAAHRELGRDFDGAVAESLVERIGAEIDKRVDARIGAPARPAAGAEVSPAARSSSGAITLALGSMLIGALIAGVALSKDHNASPLIALIWIIIGVINVAYARRR